MLAYGSPGEKLAAVSASEDIFVQICLRVGPALIRNYGLTAEQIMFFTAHDQIGEVVKPVDDNLLARYTSPTERQLVTRAVRLSHEYELMFYDTIMDLRFTIYDLRLSGRRSKKPPMNTPEGCPDGQINTDGF
jgi:thiaminase/transcriptional activator TenA